MTHFAATNFQWTVPGVTVSNYIISADSNSAMVYTHFTTNNAGVVFYWIDGATNRILQCSATVNGKEITGQAVFNVICPVPVFSAQIFGQILADTNYYGADGDFIGGAWLHFGDNKYTNGIDFNLTNAPIQFLNGTPLKPFIYGNYFIRQLTSVSDKWNDASGTNFIGESYVANGLDTRLYLNGRRLRAYYHITGFHWSDSPASPIGGGIVWRSRSDSFQSYLMFQPLGSNSIAVPMKLATWGCSGTIKTNGTSDHFVLQSPPLSQPVVMDTAVFPIWTNIVVYSSAHIQTNSSPYNEN